MDIIACEVAMLSFLAAVVQDLFHCSLGKLRDITENIRAGERDSCEVHSIRAKI